MPHAVLDSAVLPASIDVHPLMLQHLEQRRQLSESLLTTQTDLSRHTADRSELVDTRAIRLRLSGVEQPEETDRLAALDQLIVAATDREAQLQRALGQLEVDARQVRAAAREAMTSAILDRSRTVVQEMATHFDAIETLSNEIENLRQYKLASLPIVPTHVCRGYLATFRAEAKAFLASLRQ